MCSNRRTLGAMTIEFQASLFDGVTVGVGPLAGRLQRTVLSRGDRALIESPTYPHASESLRAHGARLVPVAVTTDEGWDELGLEQALQRTSPTLGYLMVSDYGGFHTLHNQYGAPLIPLALCTSRRHVSRTGAGAHVSSLLRSPI